MAEPEISPNDLKFRFQLNKTLPATINIHNPHKQRLAFKVKTTTPKKYCVKPSSGSVEPHGSTIVQVSMQASKEMPNDLNNCKDKFLIQTVLLNPGEEVQQDSFRKDNKLLRETKLRVILEGPPAPPSPVPEANEGEEDAPTSEFKAFSSTRANGAAEAAAAIPTPAAASASVAPSVKPSTLVQPAAANTGAEQSLLAGKYEKLRLELERSERERKDLSIKLDRLSLNAAKVSTVPKSPMAKAMQDKRWSLVHLILVAIVAFLVGHFT